MERKRGRAAKKVQMRSDCVWGEKVLRALEFLSEELMTKMPVEVGRGTYVMWLDAVFLQQACWFYWDCVLIWCGLGLSNGDCGHFTPHSTPRWWCYWERWCPIRLIARTVVMPVVRDGLVKGPLFLISHTCKCLNERMIEWVSEWVSSGLAMIQRVWQLLRKTDFPTDGQWHSGESQLLVTKDF